MVWVDEDGWYCLAGHRERPEVPDWVTEATRGGKKMRPQPRRKEEQRRLTGADIQRTLDQFREKS